jgi:hypothetical protein
VDLFVPGTGTPATQVHDFNGGILASGLFWTVPADEGNLRRSRDGGRAVLELRDVPVIDSFQFFGPTQVPASVSMRVEWRATGPFERHGSGSDVPDTDPAAFLGKIAPARSKGTFAGQEWGFGFRATGDTAPQGWAQLGRTRNGAFL